MQDELSHGAALSGFVPFTGGDEAEKLLAKWTKYNQADPDVWNVRLSDDTSLVLVRNPLKGTLAIVARTLEEQVDLGEGKTFNRYSVPMICPVESVEEGKDILQEVRRTLEFKTARDIDGFGSTPVDPPAEGEEVGF